jgi:hypothetical protein
METLDEPNSEKLTLKDGCYLLGVLFTILVLMTAACGLAFYGLSHIQAAFNSPNWATTEGEIAAAYVDKSGSENTGFSYTAKVEYTYVVTDWRYQSERIGFDEPVQDTPEKAEAIIAPYEVGQPVIVYYDPDNVNSAVLEPGPSWNIIWFCVTGLFLFLFALAVVISFLRSG